MHDATDLVRALTVDIRTMKLEIADVAQSEIQQARIIARLEDENLGLKQVVHNSRSLYDQATQRQITLGKQLEEDQYEHKRTHKRLQASESFARQYSADLSEFESKLKSFEVDVISAMWKLQGRTRQVENENFVGGM